jgi:hypothetical protein
MLTKPEVISILGPYHSELAGSVRAAWARYLSARPALSQRPYPRSRANLIYDLFFDEVSRRFDGDPDIRIIELPQNFRLIVRNQVVLRMKKLDSRYLSRSIPTQTALAFEGQQLVIPGFPTPTAITLGYILNDDEEQTDIQEVAVVCTSEKDHVVWAYSLDDRFDAEVLDIPAASVAHGELIRQMVQPKSGLVKRMKSQEQ